jgi:ABC-type oligopeptide transport system substrate-binding subunit
VLAEKQELVRNNGSEPASLDPHKVESDVEFNIISDLFEGLVSVSPAGEIQPRLAESGKIKRTPSGPSIYVRALPGRTGPPLPLRILSGAGSDWSLL